MLVVARALIMTLSMLDGWTPWSWGAERAARDGAYLQRRRTASRLGHILRVGLNFRNNPYRKFVE